MTLEELDQEDLTLREVMHDLQTLLRTYESWIKRNELERHNILGQMQDAAGR